VGEQPENYNDSGIFVDDSARSVKGGARSGQWGGVETGMSVLATEPPANHQSVVADSLVPGASLSTQRGKIADAVRSQALRDYGPISVSA
jgi:hypothetical protein